MLDTVPRALFALAAAATMVEGEVLDGLCLLVALAIWARWDPCPGERD